MDDSESKQSQHQRNKTITLPQGNNKDIYTSLNASQKVSNNPFSWKKRNYLQPYENKKLPHQTGKIYGTGHGLNKLQLQESKNRQFMDILTREHNQRDLSKLNQSNEDISV